jgi:hypothetical protein
MGAPGFFMPKRTKTLEKMQEQSKRRYTQKDVEVLIIYEPAEELPMKKIAHNSFLKKVKSIKPSEKQVDWNKIKKFAV